MAQLIVNVARLNRRNRIPTGFPDKGSIIGTVQKGFRFESVEETTNLLGRWYKDGEGAYYWGGGLLVLDAPLTIPVRIDGLPVNLPDECKVGIDISHHNGTIDWAAIKTAGVSFVYLKIAEGVGTPDEMAKPNAATAKRLGFKVGYYHFCRPDTRNGGSVTADATAEAEEALNRMSTITPADLPLVLDLEDQQHWDSPLNKQDYLRWINTFINRIKLSAGLSPMIYSRKEYLDRKLPPNHDLGQYKLWISFYPEHPDTHNIQCPVGWNDWAMWQYTEHGIIGRNAKVDINILKDQSLF